MWFSLWRLFLSSQPMHRAAFHLGLHCLQKYSFRGFLYKKVKNCFNMIVSYLGNSDFVVHYSCINTYSYSCFNPLSNEHKSMFKSGDPCAVWTWVWTWKYMYLKWAICMTLYGKHCSADWSCMLTQYPSPLSGDRGLFQNPFRCDVWLGPC